jgi:hypothetical protein
MLLDESGSAAGILARHRRSRSHQHVNLAIRAHSEQAETEPSAKVAKPCVVFTPLLARRKASGEPNFVVCGSAIDTLQNELEVEGQLELADQTTGGSSPLNANGSHPPISPLTTKSSPSRKVLTGR